MNSSNQVEESDASTFAVVMARKATRARMAECLRLETTSLDFLLRGIKRNFAVMCTSDLKSFLNDFTPESRMASLRNKPRLRFTATMSCHISIDALQIVGEDHICTTVIQPAFVVYLRFQSMLFLVVMSYVQHV